MPRDNCFGHQTYSTAPPTASYEFVVPSPPVSEDSPEFAAALARDGERLRQAGVRAIVLVHGTFLGADPTGLFGIMERFLPQLANSLRDWEKGAVDALVGDLANYDERYVSHLDSGINPSPTTPRIHVSRFVWSSENHHLGRADGAVRLIARLQELPIAAGDRFLLWGHSHAGNLFAILSHLVGGSGSTRRRFFECARSHYQRPIRGTPDVPVWQEVSELLERSPPNWRPDIVTFGTPVRYGWESAGYRSLLHIVNHTSREGHPSYRAPFPPTLEQITRGTEGDFIQQFGIAGTNLPVNLLNWRDWLAETRLHGLLQEGQRRRDTWNRLKSGARVAEEGTTLLVNYHEVDPESAQILAGHAIYTRSRWLPFHLNRAADYVLSVKPHE